MVRPHLPLSALCAFEASARHLSFIRAAIELYVTQAAISHQVKSLEERFGAALLKHLPRGLMSTHEGESLLPVLCGSFDRIVGLLERFEGGHYRGMLTVGAVGIFTAGWPLLRLEDFQVRHPFIGLRPSTHNNRVDIAAEGLDYAIRSGGGAWYGTKVLALFEVLLMVLCCPEVAIQLRGPAGLLQHTLLRPYRADERLLWFRVAGLSAHAPLTRSIVFDTPLTMLEAARQGVSVALAPAVMFARQLASESIQRPFTTEVGTGSYWLMRSQPRGETSAMLVFREWLLGQAVLESEAQRYIGSGIKMQKRPFCLNAPAFPRSIRFLAFRL